MERVGMYAWGGPATIRMIRTKWRDPLIDERSFLDLYDAEFLDRAQAEFGLSDLWMTYSWGFSDATEREQYGFIAHHLPEVRRRGIRAYGYVQGTNLVSREFADVDFYARSPWGSRVPYSRNRDLLCPRHPGTLALVSARAQAAAQAGFDAVYIDNIIAGTPPFFVAQDFSSSFGCHCAVCTSQFKEAYGYDLRQRPETMQELSDMIIFRVEGTTRLIADVSARVRAHGAEFGVNLFDPYFYTPEIVQGYSLADLIPHLDYIFIENLGLSLSGAGVTDDHLEAIEKSRPRFAVSYRRGIGSDAMIDRETIAAVRAHARDHGYHACIKATEFVTDGVWHAFDFERLDRARPPMGVARRTPVPGPRPLHPAHSLQRAVVRVVDRPMATIVRAFMDNTVLQTALERSGTLTRILRTPRLYVLPDGITKHRNARSTVESPMSRRTS